MQYQVCLSGMTVQAYLTGRPDSVWPVSKQKIFEPFSVKAALILTSLIFLNGNSHVKNEAINY